MFIAFVVVLELSEGGVGEFERAIDVVLVGYMEVFTR